MLKGVRKMDKYLTDWCKANGFNVKCRFSTDFEYESTTNTVFYSLMIPCAHDKLFSSEVCGPLLKKDCNIFLLSLFHEIGHQKTEAKFDDVDMDDYYDMVEKLNNKKRLTQRDYKEYYFNDVEYAATKWGCNYINKHMKKINQLYDGLVPIINDFYIKNGVEA